MEVEQWSDLVDQSPLGACMIKWYQWTRCHRDGPEDPDLERRGILQKKLAWSEDLSFSRWSNRRYLEDLPWTTPEPEVEGDIRFRKKRKAVQVRARNLIKWSLPGME